MRLMLTLLLLSATSITAQEPRRQAVGSVSGHVTCADTQRPARLAAVRLVRVPESGTPAKGVRLPVGGGAAMGDAVETGLDGAYTLTNVKPGEYYLVVDKEGYLLPLAEFSLEKLAAAHTFLQADEPTRLSIDRAVHTITVRGDQTTTEDVRLERGASVAGRATYDDGTPAGGLGVQILQKDAKGKWVNVQIGRYRESFGFERTDDKGMYRLTGLPAGQYVTEIDLTLSDHETTFLPMPGNPDGQMEMHTDKTRFSLPLYSGDKLRRQTAEPYSLGAGQELTGADVVFPLAKLHRVSGQLLARDGHPLTAGKLELMWADDGGLITETDVRYADRAFYLEFVPEGEFTLKASGGKDITKIQVENAPGYQPRFHEESKTIKTYGDAEQALIVKGETSDVSVVVPESKSR